jgi:hypothetical protein
MLNGKIHCKLKIAKCKVKIERPQGTREEKTQRAEGIERRVKTARAQVARAGRKRTKRKMQSANCWGIVLTFPSLLVK